MDIDVALVSVVLRHPFAVLPLYAHGFHEDAGADLSSVEECLLYPGTSRLIDTGISLELPPGYEAQVRSRSGLALKHQVAVLNSPGTIDPSYRGPIKVLLINHGPETFRVTPGMRIAQMVISRYSGAKFIQVNQLSSESSRGTGGYGSSGLGELS